VSALSDTLITLVELGLGQGAQLDKGPGCEEWMGVCLDLLDLAGAASLHLCSPLDSRREVPVAGESLLEGPTDGDVV